MILIGLIVGFILDLNVNDWFSIIIYDVINTDEMEGIIGNYGNNSINEMKLNNNIEWEMRSYDDYCLSFNYLNDSNQFKRNAKLNCKIKRKNKCDWNVSVCENKYTHTCKVNYVNEMFQYPYNKHVYDDLSSKCKYINNLKYLVVAAHGGALLDALSYMVEIIGINRNNIASICVWGYCENLRVYIEKYHNIEITERLWDYHETFLPREMNRQFVFNNNIEKYQNEFRHKIFNINSNFSEMLNSDGNMDVTICVFPSFQCVLLFPFTKVMIIRFTHRYDHHIAWDGYRVKWAKILHYASKCDNIIYYSSNAYDYMYVNHLAYLNENKHLIWPNTGSYLRYLKNTTQFPFNAKLNRILKSKEYPFMLIGAGCGLMNFININITKSDNIELIRITFTLISIH